MNTEDVNKAIIEKERYKRYSKKSRKGIFNNIIQYNISLYNIYYF